MTNQTPGTAGSKIAVIIANINGIKVPTHNNKSGARKALLSAIGGDNAKLLETSTKVELGEVKTAIGGLLSKMYNTPAAIVRSGIAEEPALSNFRKFAMLKDLDFDLTDELGWIWRAAETPRSDRLGDERAGAPR